MDNNNNSTAQLATKQLEDCLRTWKQYVIRYGKYYNGPDGYLQLLCNKGADLQYLESERGFALITHVFWNRNLIQFFVDKGMDINSQDENGDTALHLALRHSRYIYPDNQKREIEFFLHELGADPSVANLRGETALMTHLAKLKYRSVGEYRATVQIVENGISKLDPVAEALIERAGANLERTPDSNVLSNYDVRFISNQGNNNVDVRNSNWLYAQTPLMLAARKGKLEDCRQLVDMGAFVNAADLQGYTPLHHAVLSRQDNYLYKCAKFLMDNGADPNLRSGSGKNAYDLGVLSYWSTCNSLYPRNKNKVLFTDGATPKKRLELLEIAGALGIFKTFLTYNDVTHLIHLWDEAMDICEAFDLEPSLQFLNNYEFLRTNRNRMNDGEVIEELRHSAMNTVERLVPKGTTKFWILLYCAPSIGTNTNNPFDVLEFMSALDLLKRSVQKFASIDEIDFESLLNIVNYYDAWLKTTLNNEAVTADGISHVHSIACLSVACFEKLMHVTNSNKVSETCMKLYVRLCFLLTSLYVRRFVDDVILSEEAFNENKVLLRSLIELDLRDGDSNSLMHRILAGSSEFELVGALLDNLFLDIKTRNRMGFEPVQMIEWTSTLKKMNPILMESVLVKMADGGAHVDAKNAWSGPNLREVFEREGRSDLSLKYDSLQCACARVLAKSVVPNGLSQKIVDFIRQHQA